MSVSNRVCRLCHGARGLGAWNIYCQGIGGDLRALRRPIPARILSCGLHHHPEDRGGCHGPHGICRGAIRPLRCSVFRFLSRARRPAKVELEYLCNLPSSCEDAAYGPVRQRRSLNDAVDSVPSNRVAGGRFAYRGGRALERVMVSLAKDSALPPGWMAGSARTQRQVRQCVCGA